MSRTDDVPCFAQRVDEVAARLYNLWRRARLNFDCPIRIPLVDFPGLVMLLDAAEWVCADERQNELPVLAWVDFEDQGRDALHMPVKCKLNYYHYAASKVRVYALAMMEQELERRLSEAGAGTID